MKNVLLKLASVICIFSLLVSVAGCTPKDEITTDQDIIDLFNENKDLFNKTAKEVEEFEMGMERYIDGVYFLFEGGLVEAYQRGNQINVLIPNNIYNDMQECFYCMDSIINEEYDENEYVLSMGYRTNGVSPEEKTVVEFMFTNEIIGSNFVLTYSEDEPVNDSAIIINENWYIYWWGEV